MKRVYFALFLCLTIILSACSSEFLETGKWGLFVTWIIPLGLLALIGFIYLISELVKKLRRKKGQYNSVLLENAEILKLGEVQLIMHDHCPDCRKDTDFDWDMEKKGWSVTCSICRAQFNLEIKGLRIFKGFWEEK
ncbi:hypothetical protein K9M48_00135 [Candidatus Gracilibacteria bacterium]|nr:hypothetical protein [Candidatus Gracilibacteria bacterium]